MTYDFLVETYLPALVVGLYIAVVLSAIMSTADSQLLVAASAISYDWNLANGNVDGGLKKTRATVVVAMSSTIGSPSPGTAMDSGLVPRTARLPP